MTDSENSCPYCNTSVPLDTVVCPGCGENLAGLLHLEYAHVIYYNEALAHAQDGDLDGAHDTLLLSLKLHPSYLPAHKLMAQLAAQSGDWSEAQDRIAQARELAPDDDDLVKLEQVVGEAQAGEKAKREQALEQKTRARRSAAEQFLASQQREVMQSFAIGAVLGGAMAELVRWLIGQSLRKG